MDHGARIEDLTARAERDRAAFDPPADPPDGERALSYLREGVGPAVAVYLDARTGGEMVRFSAEEFAALEDAMNTWFELYAACHGVDLDAAFTVREAAELLVETHNVADVAAVLTKVPADGVTGSTAGSDAEGGGDG